MVSRCCFVWVSGGFKIGCSTTNISWKDTGHFSILAGYFQLLAAILTTMENIKWFLSPQILKSL